MTSWQEKGMERGIQKGMEKERQTIAFNLLRQGISIDVIVQATGLNVSQLQHLQDLGLMTSIDQ